MNPEILNQLKDIHLPAAPSWWPPAFGYYVLIIVLTLLILLLYFYIHRQSPRWALKKYLKNSLLIIKQEYFAHNNNSMLQNNIAQLIRRVGLNTQLAPTDDLKIYIIKLFGDNAESLELYELLHHERFQKTTNIQGTRLLALADKKFMTCKL